MSTEKFNNQSDNQSGETEKETEYIQDEKQSELFSETQENAPKKKRRIFPKHIALSDCICACVAIVIVAVMLTYTVCNNMYRSALDDAIREHGEQTAEADGNNNAAAALPDGLDGELKLISDIFKTYSIYGMNDEDLSAAVLKAYVAATGDRYAAYYTDEEYKLLMEDIGGKTQGIGVNIINDYVDIAGLGKLKALKIVNVVSDSPADKAEVRFNDYIFAVGSLDDYDTVNELDYDKALKLLQGVAGTQAEFIIYREGHTENNGYIEFSIKREEFTSDSVMYRKAEGAVGENIGVIKIIEFDSTTPDGVEKAIEALKAEGCTKFAFDVRYNPGGTLDSIVATLSFFLDEGDVVIRTRDNADNEEATKVAPFSRENGCTVTAEDIGKYKDLNMVVLCNESTASAAELFVANFMDHKLAEVVGTQTYGKGSMQSYISLAYFGGNGVLKLTRHKYLPPVSDCYDEVGINPTHEIEQAPEALTHSIYDIYYTAKDAQLVEAVKHFK